MEPELNRHGSGHQCRSSAAAVVAVAIAAVGGHGSAGGVTAQAGCAVLGDYPRHPRRDLLAHRDVHAPKSATKGKSLSVLVALGVSRNIKQKTQNKKKHHKKNTTA